MERQDLRIVFMGTPEFAVESLRALVENDYHVVGVITMPDKPSGRGHKMQSSAVKGYAVANNLPVLQPEKLKDESFLNALAEWKADIQVVVAFRMLPEVVWNMPPLGTFNLHASLLPQYRGAAPINWAIINGESETGVTTFFLSDKIDTGKIIFQEKMCINEFDTAGDVHDRLMKMGSELVLKTVDCVLSGDVFSIDQGQLCSDVALLKPAPKLFRETCCVDWYQGGAHLVNFIRGLSPYPAAWSVLNDSLHGEETVKLLSASFIEVVPKHGCGFVCTDNKTFFDVACADGYVRITEMQFPGKKAMRCDEILRGRKFADGCCFVCAKD